MDAHHKPVMVGEVLAALRVKGDGAYIDCTTGEGGHSLAILGQVETGPRLLGIDLDEDALSTARRRLREYDGRATLAQGSYADLEEMSAGHGFMPADGVLFDLGLSSAQLKNAERGFSFARPGKLDMRFDMGQGLTAHDVVNQRSEQDLANIIRRLGEEPAARRIARAIVRARPIESTTDLADIVRRTAGGRRRRAIHPATRTFQALRIAVNGELDNIKEGLAQAIRVLGSSGRLVVISYHSLEDREVKTFLRTESSSCICPPGTPECICGHEPSIRLIRRRVIKPSQEEISANPRSRSARLRVAERL
jgi:16S rRNA (cytosine1402-N4)-methyltransferase